MTEEAKERVRKWIPAVATIISLIVLAGGTLISLGALKEHAKNLVSKNTGDIEGNTAALKDLDGKQEEHGTEHVKDAEDETSHRKEMTKALHDLDIKQTETHTIVTRIEQHLLKDSP